jgi:TMEM175 potassium channel family protein
VDVSSSSGHFERSLDRVVFFADAVFAIAITLLVLEIAVPNVAKTHLQHALGTEGWEFFSFALSFGVIGNWWIAHHRIFGYIVRVNARFLRINLLFLMAIVFVPFPTAVLGRYSDSSTAVILYAATIAGVGVAAALLWWYASDGHRLVVPDLRERRIRYFRLRSLIVPLVFLTSIPIALSHPYSAELWWIWVPVLAIILSRVYPDSLGD